MTTYPCPHCGAPADLTGGCSGCGRGPDPDAAEVIRLDAEIGPLAARAADTRRALGAMESRLRDLWARRNAAASRVVAARAAAGSVARSATSEPGAPRPSSGALSSGALSSDGPLPRGPSSGGPSSGGLLSGRPGRNPEASTRLVQNALFLLGGLLLGIAAIVFTAVAWSQFGVGGRALVLAAVTVAALGVPPLVSRRGLRGTAETFAAVGLLLVVLDGYAAWYVDLFGVADRSPYVYAGAVGAVTAGFAAGYGHLTRLSSPRFAALAAAQPVLPLLAVPLHPGLAGWSFLLSAVAVLDLAVSRGRIRTPIGAAAYALAGLAVLAAGLFALVRLSIGSDHALVAAGGAALVTAAVIAVAGAVLARSPLAQAITGGLLVVALALAAGRYAAVAAGLGRPGAAAATFAGVVVIGLATAWAANALTAGDRPRPAGPDSGGPGLSPDPGLLDRRRVVGGLGLAAGLLALPALGWAAVTAIESAAGRLPGAWPARAALAGAALVVAAALVAARRWSGYRWYAVAAALLAVATAPAWPGDTGDPMAPYAAAALILVSLLVPAWRPAPHAVVGEAVSVVAGAVLGLSLLGAAAASLGAVLVEPWSWWYHVWSGAPAGLGLDPAGTARVSWPDVVAVAMSGIACGLAARLLADRPAGRGGSTPDSPGAAGPAAPPVRADRRAAVTRAAPARDRPGRYAGTWAAVPALVIAVPMAFAATRAPWPVVPSVGLLVGLVALIAAALRVAAPVARAVVAFVGIVVALAGLAGSLPTSWATLRGLGAVLIAAVVVGAAARDLPTRLAGWLAAGAAVPAAAYTAARAYRVDRPDVAFAVLGAAVLVLAAGTVLRGRSLPVGRHARARPAAAEARAVEAAGHAGAVLALLLTLGYARNAAAVCTLWGVALGLRALWPGERAGVRRALIVAAAGAEVGGWWLLLAAQRVSTLEAYTLPGAALGLLAGWFALRSRPDLTSWTAYGPGLAAALLPTLAAVLIADGQPVRRLLLGLFALAVVVAGARARLRAPVIIGGLVLLATAVNELNLVWDLLPRWIPLAAGGLLLVGLAMTLERRRRDLARLRSALTRMS